MPVNTMAIPAESAAAMTSSSRIDPPGWISAVTPASIAASTPSANGKTVGKGDVDALRFYIDARAKLGREWHQHFAPAGIHGEQRRRARKFHVAHGTESRPGARFPHLAADQIAYVVASGVQRRAFFQRHLNFQAAQVFRCLRIFHIHKMKNRLAPAAGRQPAAPHAHTARRAAPAGQPHFAQLL